jgi:hypothetical protein
VGCSGVCTMADQTRQSEINRNIKRNLGVFTVPTYLYQADPYDKYGAADCSTQARPARRDGLSRNQPSAWWREGIEHEWRRTEAARRAVAVQPSSLAAGVAAPSAEPCAAPALSTALHPGASTTPTAGSWVYHAAGITAQGPGGVPSLVYVPYWVPIAQS